MSPFQNLQRLYATYLSMGLKKDAIARKLKSQFPGAKLTFKGSALYVSFDGNAAQKA